jgi:hypothetical protein
VEVGVVTDGAADFLADVLPGVMFEADDGRALYADTVFAKFARELARVGALEFAVVRFGRLEAHPQPGDAKVDEFLRGVFANRVGGGEYRHAPALAGLLHAMQELHGALAVQKKVLIHHEEGWDFQGALHVAHQVEEFVAGLVELTNFPLPPKKEDVVQKLQPIGQPTDGMMVAAVEPSRSGSRTPRIRVCMPETISG